MVKKRFNEAKKYKVVILDYDGTLTATHQLPEFAKPTHAIISTLQKLAKMENTLVYVISGRSRNHLEKWYINSLMFLTM